MPQLRELDLTGNGLAHLPTFLEFRKFPTLERLSLERNKLRGDAADGGGAVGALSGLQRLRELSLAHNKVRGVPSLDAIALATGASETAVFVDLVALNLACNPGQHKGAKVANFKGSYLGRFPLVLADFWTSDHLSERSRSMDVGF